MTLMVGLSVPTEETPASVRVQRRPRWWGNGGGLREQGSFLQAALFSSMCQIV